MRVLSESVGFLRENGRFSLRIDGESGGASMPGNLSCNIYSLTKTTRYRYSRESDRTQGEEKVSRPTLDTPNCALSPKPLSQMVRQSVNSAKNQPHFEPSSRNPPLDPFVSNVLCRPPLPS